jgi:RNA polymerase sigma-70 factor (ECF subfamily)
VSPDSALRDAFANLVESYASPIRRLCAVYATDPADREDLFQDICLAIWRALPAFRRDASERTWLYRIAHNVALTWQTRSRRRHAREAVLERDVASTTPSADHQIAMREALATLSPGDKTLMLLWLEGLTAAEIEAVTGVRAATVAVRLSRLRKQLAPREVKHA